MKARHVLVLAAALWPVLVASVASPWPPQLQNQPLRLLVNRWPAPCEEVLIGGGPLQHVSIDLGFRHTAWRDDEEFGVNLGRSAFAARLLKIVLQRRALVALDLGASAREKAIAVADMNEVLRPHALEALYRVYAVQSAKVTGIDPAYTLSWVLTLVLPAAALLALGLRIRQRDPELHRRIA